MHLLCRADAGPELGVGHAVRVLALAEAALSRGWRVTVAGDIAVPWLRRDLSVRGLDPVAGFHDDESMHSMLTACRVDVVAVDNYALPATLRDVATAAGAVLLSVEDFAFGRRPADVVVNYHVGAAQTQRPDDGSRVVLLGPVYAPVRAAVLGARLHRAARAHVDAEPLRALVVMGGTDPTGVTSLVLDVLARTGHRLEVTVVGGNAISGRHGGLEVRALPGGQQIPVLLADADLAVSAAGVGTYETFCTGVPTAVLAVVDNQVPGYRELVAHRFCHGLGTALRLRAEPQVVAEGLRVWLEDVDGRTAMAATALTAVDGRGSDRVLDAVAGVAG